jgi:hypothetical protein
MSQVDGWLPLAEAVARYHRARREARGMACGTSLSWYMRGARQDGTVYMGDVRPRAVKSGGRWYVDPQGVAEAIEAIAAEAARLRANDLAYKNRKLPASGTLQTTWGHVDVSREGFHFVYNERAAALQESAGHWECSSCGKSATTEHNKPECHRCSDWSGCGMDCTLSGVSCKACGTSMPL